MENSTNEIWKVIPQFKSAIGQPVYEVSNTGKVRRMLYYGHGKNGLVGKGKTFPITSRDVNGVECVLIRQQLKEITVPVNDLVNSAFS